ncbi:MAG: outer membrane lipoprotein carrier protein LolA [bacterium]|nr:outer membrane lipoprotein carrier protein LolA [bacterium]
MGFSGGEEEGPARPRKRKKAVRPYFFAALLGAALCGPFPAAAAAPQGAAPAENDARTKRIAVQLQIKYEKTRTLFADFEQENLLRSLGKITRSKGRFSLRKPGRIRFDYREPERQMVVSNGKTLWIYTESLRQVLITPLNSSAASPTPLLFLAGKGRLEDSFRITVEEWGAPRQKEGVWKQGTPHRLSLTPIKMEGGFRNLWLEVDVESFQILGFEFRDHLGNETRIRFFNIREGVAFDNGDFEFKIPPGVEVFRTPSPLGQNP